MGKVVHLSVKSRYRLILLTTIFVFIYAFSSQDGRGYPLSTLLAEWPSPLSALRVGELWNRRQAAAHDDSSPGEQQQQVPLSSLESEFFTWSDPNAPAGPKPPYKPARKPAPPIPDPFPLLSANPPPKNLKSLLRAPEHNRPPRKHYPEKTPLLIGFTRNWPQLLQCVVSYVAAGWPPEDIYVVENTGTMFSNRENRLTLQNPFYLNHTQLSMLGVNVIITPTLLTFAQLQNFYLHEALVRSWPAFFWTHQDLVVFSDESAAGPGPYYTLYDRAVGVLQYLLLPSSPRWAHHFFAYDHLTLVNRDAVLEVGGWDAHIPFYATDCDMYVRLMWAGYWQGESEIGIILDVNTVLDDVGALLRIPGIRASFAGDDYEEEEENSRNNSTTEEKEEEEEEEDESTRKRLDDQVNKNGETWERLVEIGKRMEGIKYSDGNTWRNTWQVRQQGGQGEPFYRDWEGFETGTKMMIDLGRNVFAEKWGHRGCDIAKVGIKAEDAWRLERDWDVEADEGEGYQGDGW
ncbi:hypothetical protein QBC42DRAFT_220274 [Cladorrhinum samala]|uniref:Uncharacterized protein n=1 Tax=Cladorrhinum samala TaxID=585594 RepID=A0AAV9HYM4_9PEZI|nr:hypothetical protein QBC42DRAFT_220274 [Cladorrhinum samala]